MTAGDYEAARERYELTRRNLSIAKAEAERLMSAAQGEFDAARQNLRRFETVPGVPLPEYREQAA